MSNAFDWYPKSFTPGDMEGGGALKLLGKPNLHLVAVLVRETAQNSWDARLRDGPVEFMLHGRTLPADGVEVLRNKVFAERGKGTRLGDVLLEDNVDVLEVTDRGTSGLGGPTRNDKTYPDESSTDYVDFVLNIGAKQDKSMGGGTYGYGKTICYLASEAQTIVVWTRTKVNGEFQSRLIASAFGEQFDLEGKRYTGRQWWGRMKSDMIEPLVGDEADEIAASIFSKPFVKDETGTSILIMSPILSEDNRELIGQCSTAVLWHLWPKLSPEPGTEPAMVISTMLDGKKQSIPDPATHPFLRGYVKSLNMVRAMQSDGGTSQTEITTCQPISSGRPKTLLGHLAISRVPCLDDRESNDPLVPVSGVSSHIALMRHEAELIVTYQSGNKPPVESVHYCGVFRPVRDVDGSFAKAEPPAHDSWEWAGIRDQTDKSRVRVAMRKMRESWSFQTQRTGEDKSSHTEVALGSLSSRLSDLVPEIGGTRAGPGRIAAVSKKKAKRKAAKDSSPNDGGIKPFTSNRNRISIADTGLSTVRAGQGVAFVKFTVEGEIRGIELTAEIGIGYDGGTDTSFTDEYVHGIHFLEGHLSDDILETINKAKPDGLTKILSVDAEPNWTLAVLFDDSVALDITLRHKQAKFL